MIDIKKKWHTRSGLDVRLVSDQGHPDWPIVGFIGDSPEPYVWKKCGTFKHGERQFDLVEVKEKKVSYLFIHSNGIRLFRNGDDSRQYADNLKGSGDRSVVTCVKIQYEEGQFDE